MMDRKPLVWAALGACLAPMSAFAQDDLVVAPASVLVSEAGLTQRIAIHLPNRPFGTVLVRIYGETGFGAGPEDEAGVDELTVLPLVFSDLNWNIDQFVTIVGHDDFRDDGDQSFGFYVAVDEGTTAEVVPGNTFVSGTNRDDDSAGLVFSPANLVTRETRSGPVVLPLRLKSEPTGLVEITVSSSDPGEGTVNQNFMVFDAENWSVDQPVTITGVDDLVYDGDVDYQLVFAVRSDDPTYSPVSVPPLVVRNEDDETGAFSVTPTNGLMTSEDGGEDEFSVRLTGEPPVPVTVSVVSDDASEGECATSELTFDPLNWSVSQTVGLRGVDDTWVDGDIAYTVETLHTTLEHVVAETSEPLNVNPGFTSGELGGWYDEEGEVFEFLGDQYSNYSWGYTTLYTYASGLEVGCDYSIDFDVLQSGAYRPIDFGYLAVPLDLFVDDHAMEGETPEFRDYGQLYDGGSRHYVYTAQSATAAFGIQAGFLARRGGEFSPEWQIDNFAVSLMGPCRNGYLGQELSELSATNVDDDRPGMFVQVTGEDQPESTFESGEGPDMDVRLTAQPAGIVTITATVSDATEARTTVSSFRFTGENWDVPQAFELLGVDDDIVDGDIDYELTFTVSSDDGLWDAVEPQVSTFTTIDDDVADTDTGEDTDIVDTDVPDSEYSYWVEGGCGGCANSGASTGTAAWVSLAAFLFVQRRRSSGSFRN